MALLSRYFSTENAGIGVYSKNILRELMNRDFELDIFSTHTEGSTGYFLYTSPELLWKMKTYDKADVYHALTPMEATWIPKEKTVATFHDLIPMLHRDKETWYFEGLFSSFKKWFGSKWFEFCCRRAVESERIICNSEQTKEDIVEHLDVDEDKITITRLGINSDLEPSDPGKYHHNGFTVGTLSYLDPRKRIGKLIEGFKKYDDPNAKLYIPSKGPDRERLEKKAEGDDRIEFLGFVPEEEKANYLSSLDCFILPSLLEGYGLTWVEAMACKVPVVSFEDALIPNDVQERTHIANEDNLSKLLDKKKFDCDIGENYEFSQLHDWKKCAEETIEVYEEVNKP